MSKVGDVVVDVRSWNPQREAVGQEIDYIDLGAIDNDAKLITSHQTILADDAPSRARQKVESGDILISTVRPYLNGVARVSDALDGATASTGFCVVRANKTMASPEYLFQWFKSPQFIADMTRKATGASYPAVSDRIIFESEMPLPPLDEQRRVAAILDQADALRRKRLDSIGKLERLPAASFFELFGDPKKNEKDFPLSVLADVAEIRLGKMLDQKKSKGGELKPYLRNANVRWFSFDVNDLFEMEFSQNELERFKIKYGDLLVCEGGEPGRCAVWRNDDREVYYQKALHRIRVREDVLTASYLSHLLHQMATSNRFSSNITSATIAHLTAEKLKKITVPIPPINLQLEFDKRIKEIDLMADRLRQSLNFIDKLFDRTQAQLFHNAKLKAAE